MEDEVQESDNLYPTVLVVDDEPLVADTVALILTRAGYRTAKAYNGTTALALALEHQPHLLLSDVAMPGMSGVELAMAVLAAVPNCKALLFSGHATSKELEVATQAGYELPLLRKPVHPTKLLEHIAAYLKRSPAPDHLMPVHETGKRGMMLQFLQTA